MRRVTVCHKWPSGKHEVVAGGLIYDKPNEVRVRSHDWISGITREMTIQKEAILWSRGLEIEADEWKERREAFSNEGELAPGYAEEQSE